MKPKQFLIPFLLISFILVFSASYQLNFEPKTEFHVTQMEIKFEELNATATIDFDVDFLTQMYIFFFGGRNLEPYLEDFLYDFDEFRFVSVRGTTAEVELINVSRRTGPYYIQDSRLLGSQVSTLILVYPVKKNDTLTYFNVTSIQRTYYEVPSSV